MIAELTFPQSLAVEVVSALATAAFVGGFAALGVRWFEGRREDARLERERQDDLRAARAGFVRQASELAGTLYLEMQVFRRCQRHPGLFGDPSTDDLDKAYTHFSRRSEVLENELGFWFGRDSRVFVLWHQVSDLLTVRYFWLRSLATDGLLDANARRPGTAGAFHSGLTLTELKAATVDDPATSTRSPAAQVVLDAYHRAMEELAGELDVRGQRTVGTAGSPTREPAGDTRPGDSGPPGGAAGRRRPGAR